MKRQGSVCVPGSIGHKTVGLASALLVTATLGVSPSASEASCEGFRNSERDRDATYVCFSSTREEMAEGRYSVSWSVYSALPMTMDFRFVGFGLDPDSLYHDFSAQGGSISVEVQKAVRGFGIPGVEVLFTWEEPGWHELSYAIETQQSGYAAGYADSNVVVAALQVALPFVYRGEGDSTAYPPGWRRMIVEYDVPSDMPVFAPFQPIGTSDRQYEIKDIHVGGSDGRAYDLNVTAWGNFTAVDSVSSMGQDLSILAYATAADNTVPLMKQTFSELLRAYERIDPIPFIAPRHVMVLFPEEWDQIDGPRSIGGGYGRDWNGDIQHLEFKDSPDFSTPSFTILTGERKWSHIVNMAHGLLNNRLPTAWCDEGVAHFLKFDLLWRLGLFPRRQLTLELRGIYEHRYLAIDDVSFPEAEQEFYGGGSLRANTIMFEKSALFFHGIDQLIRHGSNFEFDLVDGIGRFYELLLEERQLDYLGREFDVSTLPLMTRAFTEIGGYDFEVFFQKYAIGAEPLPFSIDGDTLSVTFDTRMVVEPGASVKRLVASDTSQTEMNMPSGASLVIRRLNDANGRALLSLEHPMPLTSTTSEYAVVSVERGVEMNLQVSLLIDSSVDTRDLYVRDPIEKKWLAHETSDLPMETRTGWLMELGTPGDRLFADFNRDGAVDVADFFLFSDAFGDNDAVRDLDGNGQVDFSDFFLFSDVYGSVSE